MRTIALLRVIITMIVWSTCCSKAAEEPSAVGSELVLQNNSVRRVLKQENGAWRTINFSRADGTDKVQTESSEFLIRLMDGKELTISDYQSTGVPITAKEPERSSIKLEYAPRHPLPHDAPQSIQVEYWLGTGPYLRKKVTLIMAEGAAIDELQVERFKTPVPCSMGGERQPLFIGKSWFGGLEYPGCRTGEQGGLVSLAHFPGRVKKQNQKTSRWFIESKTAVLGTGLKGDPLELAFNDYVETIRVPRATHHFLAYNTYFDINADQCTPEKLLPKMDCFRTNLVERYGTSLDAFTIDNSYDKSIWDYHFVWTPKKEMYPSGLDSLSKALEKRGSRLGLWNSVAGFHLTLDEYYERAILPVKPEKDYYCASAPHYNSAYRKAIQRIITEGNVPYLKLDYLMMQCLSAEHGHLPDARHSIEANLDAHLELIAAMREVRPDIFLDLMAHNQLSPWWLMYGEDSYGGGYDVGYAKPWPQLAPFEWALNDRDVNYFNLYQSNHLQMPLSTLTPHGLVKTEPMTRYGGDDETLREWSDYVLLTWARGVQTKLLYITPEILKPEQWRVLGQATRWAAENSKILENAVMFGGDPSKGQIYGFASWAGDKGIVALRNPDVEERTGEVPFDKSVHYRGTNGKPFRARLVYPYVEDVTNQFFSGRPMRFTIPGYSVTILEIDPGMASQNDHATLAPLNPGAARVKEGQINIILNVPDEELQRCDLCLIGRGNDFDFYYGAEWPASAKKPLGTGRRWRLVPPGH